MSLLNLFRMWNQPDETKENVSLDETDQLLAEVLQYQQELIARLDGEDELWRKECLSDDTRVCPAIRPRKVSQE